MDRSPKESSLLVNRIQRFCIQDGPGVRTTVFLQGCTLRCWWCHNPDTRPAHHPREREWTTTDLADHVGRDERYWRRSGGGITLSGGEPLMRIEAACGFLDECGRRRWHRAVETAGAVGRGSIQRAAQRLDHWLFDLKTVDAGRFQEATGGDLQGVLENLRWLLGQTSVAVTVRIPLIRGFNDDPASWDLMAACLRGMPRAAAAAILPGHDVGVNLAECPGNPAVERHVAEAARQRLETGGIQTALTW